MYFFVNTVMRDKKTGIEHAQIKRLKLFKKHHREAKIVVRDYDRTFHHYLKNVGLDDADMISMFDFFQKATDFKARPFQLKDLPVIHGQKIITKRTKEGSMNVYVGKQLVSKIYTFDWDDQQIDKVAYFDQFGNNVSTDVYDSRGFKSMNETFSNQHRVMLETMFDVNGQMVYKSHYMKNRLGNLANSALRLINYKGNPEINFVGLKNFTRFFIDELNRSYGEKNVFVVDRNYGIDWPMQNMQTEAFKLLQLHNVQSNTNNLETGRLNYNYEYGLDHQGEWNGVIALGETQQHDVEKRFPKSKIYAIGGGIINDEVINGPKIPYEKRTMDKVVVIARLTKDKHVEKVVKAVAKAKTEIPDITLDVYGVGPEHDNLEKLIKNLNVADRIKLKGYINNLNPIYDQAMVSVLSSDAEGLPLSLIEAQSHGIPLIARDVIYGPNDIITNERDGYLIAPDNKDIDNIANALVQTLADKAHWQSLSDAAYEDRMRFSTDSMWRKWDALNDDVLQYYEEGEK
ncbi:glycosyltransferase [Secundilactobacillus hailunensis]|uniref:Glycosyltransferase n=1 Tax=Secundilactobacillus hailunensis TaxID=2559923 RepID=A0ABW1T8P8_9LACO|nr:glycosyltransferase [Secundilactobacillus hailunensis]